MAIWVFWMMVAIIIVLAVAMILFYLRLRKSRSRRGSVRWLEDRVKRAQDEEDDAEQIFELTRMLQKHNRAVERARSKTEAIDPTPCTGSEQHSDSPS